VLRLSELKLPLDHSADALAPAICKRLKLDPEALQAFRIVRQSVDARRKEAIQLAYSVDLDLAPDLETKVLRRFSRDPHLQITPDTVYRPVTQAPAEHNLPRPVVVGAGPCGYFCALLLAEMGLSPCCWSAVSP
jgi:uncharacterized FAD-dependent dehydrogenase